METQEELSDDVCLGAYLNKCEIINEYQVQKLNKHKENKVCEESHHNDDN